MKHDYKAALEWLNTLTASRVTDYEHKAAVTHALKLADKITGEKSEGMIKAFYEAHPDDIFKDMIAQAEKEIEECTEV